MQFINPTGKGIRNDAGGAGYFGAPRGSRLHNGLDFMCKPGQEVRMPVSGIIVRESLPYAGDLKWRGVYIVSPRIEIKMWYLDPYSYAVGQRFNAGDAIGIAQDIGEKYDDVTAHVHMRIVKVDPALLFPLEHEEGAPF